MKTLKRIAFPAIMVAACLAISLASESRAELWQWDVLGGYFVGITLSECWECQP